MKRLSLLLLVQAVSLTTAGIIVPVSKIIEGPSSKTTLVGPDGSVITSVQKGAKIVTDGDSALVAPPDTLAVLKEAEHPVIVETKLEPAVALNLTPVEPVIAHHTFPVIKSHLEPVIAHHTFPVIKSHLEPVIAHHVLPVVKSHLEPVIAAHPNPTYEVETHVEPAIASKTTFLKAEPVVAHVGTKTTISEQSQSIIHPAPLLKTNFKPVVAQTNHLEPIITVHSAPATIVKSLEPLGPVIAPAYRHVFPEEAHHVAPLKAHHSVANEIAPVLAVKTEAAAAAKQVPSDIPIIGTKQTISEYSQAVVHPREAVVSKFVPIVTAKVVKQHAIPVVTHQAVPVFAQHVVPAIGTETKISENSQTLVSHSW